MTRYDSEFERRLYIKHGHAPEASRLMRLLGIRSQTGRGKAREAYWRRVRKLAKHRHVQPLMFIR